MWGLRLNRRIGNLFNYLFVSRYLRVAREENVAVKNKFSFLLFLKALLVFFVKFVIELDLFWVFLIKNGEKV